MTTIKKLFRYLLIFFVILIILSPFWVKNIPLKYLSFLTGKTAVVDNYVCKYSIQVGGDSMEPIIAKGSSIELNRCFEDSDLTNGVVVLYGQNSELHLGVIRYVLSQNPIVYKVSNERPQERLQNVIKGEIVAINNNIDTSKTTFQDNQSGDSFTLNPTEYLSDFYLGKIPRGYGVEMAEVEKTNVFSKDNDKFCAVTLPKKELAFVNINIIDAKTQEVVVSSKSYVLNVRSNPNVDCEDFGSGQEMLNLKVGNYYYELLLNHQVLEKVPFSVK